MQGGQGCPFSHTQPGTRMPYKLPRFRGEGNKQRLIDKEALIISAVVNYTNYGVNW